MQKIENYKQDEHIWHLGVLSVSQSGNLKATKSLTQKGADVNLQSRDEHNMSPLQAASTFQNFKIAKVLIYNGADTLL